MSQSREKQFAKNTMILSIGTLGSKVFTFLLLPLYTAVLTTEDYGNVDVLQTVIQLAIPVITLQLAASIFRFLIDQTTLEEQIEVITNSTAVITLNSIIGLIVILVVNSIWSIPYYGLLIVCYITSTLYKVLQNVVRGFGHNGLYSLTGFIAVLSSLIINLILILGMGMKGESILIALASSNLLASLVIIIKEKMWNYIRIKAISKEKTKELLSYSLPLIPNEISWWIANSSDRFLILFYLGSSFNGIYAAANKIPTIYSTVFNVFNLAWIESVSRNINDSDREEFINGMLDRFFKLFMCLCFGILCSISLLFRFLIGAYYSDAYNHIFILTVAIMIHSMCALYGSVFSAFKESKIIGTTTILGAVANIIINFSLINVIGLYAASISTLISYAIVLIVRICRVRKLIHLKWPINYFIRAFFFGLLVTFGYFFRNDYINIFIFVIVATWSFMENRSVIIGFLRAAMRKVRKV